MRRLPFLNGVRAFEAAARGGGFSAAGAELNVTQAAVSRMVRLLEARMGVKLFDRRANRLSLTAAGAAYLAGLTPLLDALERLSADVARQNAPRVLTVGMGPSFATRWLIPRLAEVQRAVPDYELRIATGGAAAPFSPDWTCAIELGNGDWPGMHAERLFGADLLPVCTPAQAAMLRTPADLAGVTLLRVAHAVDDWPRWFAAAGVAGIPARGPAFGLYGQALQAALDGVGVAMGIRPYVDDDLAAGRLVAPFGATVSKGRDWYLVHDPARSGDPGFIAFRRWITLSAAAPGPRPD